MRSYQAGNLEDQTALIIYPRGILVVLPKLLCFLRKQWMLRNPSLPISLALLVMTAPTAAAAADDFSKPIHVSPDGHFLMQPNGSPFFFLGENAEYLFWRLNREETDSYLKDRAQKGFTVIMAHVVPRQRMNEPNVYGATAFIEGDVTRPNPKYFEHVDWVIERAAHYGLRIGLVPINGIEYVAEQSKFTLANVDGYARWLGRRYRDKGIIWILGFDSTPVWAEGPWLGKGPTKISIKDFTPIYTLAARALTAGSGGHAFITFHPPCCNFIGTAAPRISLYLANQDWLDMNMLQSGHLDDPVSAIKGSGLAFGWTATYSYEPIREEYDSLPVRPIVNGEANWEQLPRNFDEKIARGRWDEVDVRNTAYESVFAGAAGHSYGHLSVFAFFVPGEHYVSTCSDCNALIHWKEALDAPGARQIGFVKTLLLSRPYFTRIPDQSVIIGDAAQGNTHIEATRDRTGSYMMIYSPVGESVTVDMNKLAGIAARAWWYDPRSGGVTKIEDTIQTNHAQRFIPPSSGHGNDWVLVLDDAARGFAPPGQESPASGMSEVRRLQSCRTQHLIGPAERQRPTVVCKTLSMVGVPTQAGRH